MHPLLKLIRYSGKYKFDIKLAVLYSFLNKIFDILPEVLIGVAVDVIVKRQDSVLAKIGIVDVKWQIISLGIFTGVIWVLESTFQYLYSLKWCYLAQNIQHDMRLDAYNHVQNLQLDYFESQSTGNLMAVLNDDINQLERFVNDGVNQILQIFISTIVIGIIFFFISAKVALLSFLPIPFIIGGAFYFRHILAPRYLKVRNQAGLLSSRLNNNLSGIATIKSFTTEAYELKQVEILSDEYRVANKKAVVLSAAFVPIIRMGVMCGFLVSLIYGGMMTLDGQIAVASYSVLIFLSQRLLWPLTYLGQVTDMYQRSMAAINRVMGVLDTPIGIVNGDLSLNKVINGNVEFKNVGFAYLEREAIFSDLSFRISDGESVAFIGSTGAGKSTLVKLILRLYERSSGDILFNGVPIDKLKLTELRRHIGIVSQDTFLIDGSIAENIAYGSFDATLDQIIAVAKLVEADEFIAQLPNGYDTLVGERGQKLSGGQRQRLALARAIIKNPALLILDEATSALDNQTEAAIQAALERVIAGRTTIMIAHRLSTVVNVNRIYVLEYGKIVEIGTHTDLLASNGIYANLWRLQSAERLNI